MSDEKVSHERILICVALVLCACILGYNAFFVPEVTTPTVIYSDTYSASTESSTAFDDKEDKKTNIEIVYDEIQDNNEEDKININTASVEELSEGLYGIGDVMANRIVEYREENGKFSTIDDITNVKGIGEVTFSKIKDDICV